MAIHPTNQHNRKNPQLRGGRRWQGSGWLSNINASTAAGLHAIRARAQHAVLNDPHAARAAEAWASNVIGTGIKPQSTAEAAETIDAVFAAWATEADSAGLTDFFGLQEAVVRSCFIAGEALCASGRACRRTGWRCRCNLSF